MGDHRESALLGDTEPGSSGLQIPAREQMIRPVPSRQGLGGTGVQFVAVAGRDQRPVRMGAPCERSEEHTSELQSLMRISYAVFCLKKNKNYTTSQKNTRYSEERQRI